MADLRRYKAINFDLNTKSLRERFGDKGRSKAYSTIRSFMKKRGFEHRQGSGYRSINTLSDLDVADFIVEMYKKLEWLPDCVQKLDVTNIGREYDLDAIAKRRIKDEQDVAQQPIFDVEL